MRNTRASARAGGIHIDDSAPMDAANVPLPTTPLPERNPLTEVSANSSEPRPEHAPIGDGEPDHNMKKGKGRTKRGRGGRKAAKDNKINLAAQQKPEAALQKPEAASQEPEVLEDDISVVSSAASGEAAEELRREYTGEIFQVAMHDERPVSPPSPAVRATRRQLVVALEHQAEDTVPVDAKSDHVDVADEHKPEEPQLKSEDDASEEVFLTKFDNLDEPKQEAAKSGFRLPLELTIKRDSHGALIIAQPAPGQDTTGTVHGPALLEQSDAHASEPVSSSPKSTNGRVEDSIEAMDALEEEIEKVQKDLSPMAVPILPGSIRKAQTTPTRKAKTSTRPSPVGQQIKDRASIASVRNSGPQKPALTTKSSSPLKPAEGAEHKTKTAVARTASLRSRNPTTQPSADRERKPVEIPCSKPRPMHLSFPTPPPPPKSTKPPTTSTFTLPGAAVAAKLKAAREERLKKAEEEAHKKPESKARPLRRSVAPAVKSTATSTARQSLMHPIPEAKDDGEKIATLVVKSMQKTTTVQAAKDGTSMSAVASRRIQTTVQKASVTTVAEPDASTENQAAPSASSKRQTISSSSTANTSKPHLSPSASLNPSAGTLKLRISSLTSNASGTSSTSRTSRTSHASAAPSSAAAPLTKTDKAAQKTKGKEVFNRDKLEKEELERKRREKEEAAKKARAEAAERGRAASRKWAEKRERGIKKSAGLGKVDEVERVAQKA